LRTLDAALRQLVDAGAVKIRHEYKGTGKRTSNAYELFFDDLLQRRLAGQRTAPLRDLSRALDGMKTEQSSARLSDADNCLKNQKESLNQKASPTTSSTPSAADSGRSAAARVDEGLMLRLEELWTQERGSVPSIRVRNRLGLWAEHYSPELIE
jgi:hypothetical protein